MKSRIETRIDKYLAELGIKPYIYHIRAYDKESQRRALGSFAAITIARPIHVSVVDVEHDVGELMDDLANERMLHGDRANPATWVMNELGKIGYNGIAICDRRDNFSRKRGRIIAKGRLLKWLRPPKLLNGT